ncbi:hypothetical protein VTJ49DRAFT_5971 [Mycothermus thermophilus]|uniref:Deubiquitination-protection protein dph1 n=1 Tax=Humicola insolens TaxID=85995 RepID=A0ABR3V290_HUMIN
MADNAEAGSDAGGETQITFKVKCPNDKTHTITMAESATVLDLKTKLAGSDYEDVPPERQRLIYSGRIMKDSDALSVYKIKNNNTVHMVKSARSNPTPASTSASTSTPTPAAVPQNMTAGTHAGDVLAGLTGARYAGHANLPSLDAFGPDFGMGAPPSPEQMADMMQNPMFAQMMNEALNNPQIIDTMIRNTPTLANVPNAREILQSPQFREMMTNPDMIRMAGRMRQVLQGQNPAFPAPGVVDGTAPANNEAGAAGSAPAGNANDNLLRALFAGNPFAAPAPGANPFASLLGIVPPAPQTPGQTPAAGASNTTTQPSANREAPTAEGTSPQGQAGATDNTTNASNPPPNPFAALFQNAPPSPFGLPPLTPEAIQQMAQMFGLAPPGSSGAAAAAPPAPVDNRPPEERYAEQLRQLNDMGFFDFDRNITALRRSGGSVQGAVEYLLSNP